VRVNCAAIEREKIRVLRHKIEIRVLEKGGKYFLKSSSVASYFDTFNEVCGRSSSWSSLKDWSVNEVS